MTYLTMPQVEKALQYWGESFRYGGGERVHQNSTIFHGRMVRQRVLSPEQHDYAVQQLVLRIEALRKTRRSAPNFTRTAIAATEAVLVYGKQKSRVATQHQVSTARITRWCNALLRQHEINTGVRDDPRHWLPTHKQTETGRPPVQYPGALLIDRALIAMRQQLGREGDLMANALHCRYAEALPDLQAQERLGVGKSLYFKIIKLAKVFILASLSGMKITAGA